MKRWIKQSLLGVGALFGVTGAGVGGYAFVQTSAYDESMTKVYDVPLTAVERSSDPDVLARGKHLAESLAACAGSHCHGEDLGGGDTLTMGPVGTITGPNITSAGLGAAYSDAELFRLIRHGIKKDGRSVTFMPSHEISWLPDADVMAVISYLRTVPPVQRANGATEIGTLGKVLDRRGQIALDIARRIDHANIELAPKPTPTAAYGRFVAKLCTGCHGESLSGGPIPGAPPSLPVPSNLTPHASGLKAWTYADFDRLLTQGIRKNGQKLDPFMAVAQTSRMDEVEKRALWEHLRSVPAVEFGNR